MGSLMAGWSSNPLDAESAMNRSKSSLTNEEIEAFWRSREKAMEEHLKDAAAQKLSTKDTFKQFYTVGEQSGTGSAPIPIQGEQVVVEESNLPIAASPDWWTRSNWAFLNEPPESHTDARHKYTPQFDVATKASHSDHIYTFQAGSSPIL
ncbi:unnamed protein product [Sphagnum jensenii]|uniref:Uncharacterized protein n=1 Tax=Sphagnum jensenii TaxID=128206 RepID=A0ABP0VR87_9BRYO